MTLEGHPPEEAMDPGVLGMPRDLLYPRWPWWRAVCLPRPPVGAPDRASVRED